MNFTSVKREELLQAFVLAHRCSEDAAIPNAQRKRFRAIALLLWEAHGEEKPMDACGVLIRETAGTVLGKVSL